MRRLLFLLLVLFFTEKVFALVYHAPLLPQSFDVRKVAVTNYFAKIENQKVIVIRDYTLADRSHWLLFVNPTTLKTGLADKASYPFSGIFSEHGQSLYEKALDFQSQQLRTFGSLAGFYPLYKKGTPLYLMLTSDLCPDRKNIERSFYHTIYSLRHHDQIKIPVILFFSGRWLKKHITDYHFLTNTIRDFYVGNHTWSHHLIKGNWPVKNLRRDILQNEKTLLKHGLIPSVFFRFPGLLFKRKHLHLLNRLHLLVFNANLWPGAKIRKNDSVLLVHSNGEVPVEPRHFIRFVTKYKEVLKKGKIVFTSPALYASRILDFYRQLYLAHNK